MKFFVLVLSGILFCLPMKAQIAGRTPVTDTQLVKTRIIHNGGKIIRNTEEHNLGFQITKDLQVIADKYKGQPGDSIIWAKMKVDAYSYFYNLWTARKLLGVKASEAFFVKTGKEVMTLQEIAAGKKVILAGFAQYKPAEFTIIKVESQ